MEGSHGALAEAARGGSVKRERRWKARYLLPCLSESKRCQRVENKGGRKTERKREREAGEETRASYCDSRAGKEGNERVREQLALKTCKENGVQKALNSDI